MPGPRKPQTRGARPRGGEYGNLLPGDIEWAAKQKWSEKDMIDLIWYTTRHHTTDCCVSLFDAIIARDVERVQTVFEAEILNGVYAKVKDEDGRGGAMRLNAKLQNQESLKWEGEFFCVSRDCMWTRGYDKNQCLKFTKVGSQISSETIHLEPPPEGKKTLMQRLGSMFGRRQSGGRAAVHVGPRGGRYVLRNGRKVYLLCPPTSPAAGGTSGRTPSSLTARACPRGPTRRSGCRRPPS